MNNTIFNLETKKSRAIYAESCPSLGCVQCKPKLLDTIWKKFDNKWNKIEDIYIIYGCDRCGECTSIRNDKYITNRQYGKVR